MLGFLLLWLLLAGTLPRRSVTDLTLNMFETITFRTSRKMRIWEQQFWILPLG